MIGDTIWEIIERRYKPRYRIKELRIPKRYYRRPDLQRLANRWYGMKLYGWNICFEFVPTSQDERIFEAYRQRRLDLTADYFEEVAIPILEYKLELKTYGFGHDLPKEKAIPEVFIQRNFEMFIADAKSKVYDDLVKQYYEQRNEKRFGED